VTRYISLAEFWHLADSALHAPQAGLGEEDFYPDPYDKAAVPACRISWNHPLPDGNKRAAWACMMVFVDLNDGTWSAGGPDVDDAVDAMLAVAALEVDEAWLAASGWSLVARSITAPWSQVPRDRAR
jgi:death-on-curing protein